MHSYGQHPVADGAMADLHYRAAWARLRGADRNADVHGASVYLPQVGLGHTLGAQALAQLAADVSFCGGKPGHVLFLGVIDVHVRVAHVVPENGARPAHAYGVRLDTPLGTRLPRLCDAHGLRYLSGLALMSVRGTTTVKLGQPAPPAGPWLTMSLDPLHMGCPVAWSAAMALIARSSCRASQITIHSLPRSPSPLLPITAQSRLTAPALGRPGRRGGS
jgi:hypothetical protein